MQKYAHPMHNAQVCTSLPLLCKTFVANVAILFSVATCNGCGAAEPKLSCLWPQSNVNP